MALCLAILFISLPFIVKFPSFIKIPEFTGREGLIFTLTNIRFVYTPDYLLIVFNYFFNASNTILKYPHFDVIDN